MMKIYLIDWISVSLKLLHIIVGIAWIGASFYFNWLENKLNRVGNRDEIAGHLWAVHHVGKPGRSEHDRPLDGGGDDHHTIRRD